MHVIFDSLTETLIGPFNDFESAQMWLLYASDEIADGGANLTIESISEPEEWAQDNQITMSALV
jgi:hypothetical protein